MRSAKILFLIVIALFSCNKNELTKDQALSLLEQSDRYPYVHSYQIYVKDSEDGKRVINAGLEKEGLVKVERNRKSGNNEGNVIEFTEAAKTYFLEPDKGQLSSVQRVKVAEEVLGEVTSLEIDEEGKSAKATYTTKFTGVTPFAKLEKKAFGEPRSHEVKFIKDKNGWRMERSE
ncbi:hypothetical protein H8S90_19355 [Olivibacter sp. SDN3]|uniref:hypothetical protein n=1 Tax=Olivibacter sp. SDN3 TaxID=2764720 RepID=UPI001650F166|nr:hypothetical protein [Olivibacter sp. SDN3]QNL48893.1 hypothetical protein H8S90_19355 [Olivibacter sp. SDN3]